MPLNGLEFGKIVQLKPYSNRNLELERQYTNKNFQFTLEIWLYAENHCATEIFCAIYQRANHANKRFTPNIFFKRDGNVI